MSGALLTSSQALHLVGLAPSLFLVIFLGILAAGNRQAFVPALYFLSLACGFALPLLELYPGLSGRAWVVGPLLMGESLLAALSFLMILQFMTGRLPAPPLWLVLAIPLLGGGSIVYAGVMQDTACVTEHSCLDAHSVKTLYNIFASSLVFLLLVAYAARTAGPSGDDAHKRHKYWLIVALILLNLFALAIDLAQLAGRVSAVEAEFIAAVFKLAFTYLVLTSLFRVLYPGMAAQVIHLPEAPCRYDPVADKPHVEAVMRLLDGERVYREMRLNRAALAKKVGIGETALSRIINGHYGKSFNELINSYRIEEAKRRLKSEPTQITTIAFEVGFNSIASFNRVFKERVGVSPTEYRGGT